MKDLHDTLEIYKNEDNSYVIADASHGDTIHDYYTIVLHQSLYFTKCFVVSNSNGELITYHEEINNLIVKREGCKELSPEDLIEKAFKCIKCAVNNFKSLNYDFKKIVCMSICTSRNAVVVWSNKTGKSLYNALAEDDCRCNDTCQKLIHKSWRKSRTNFQHLCGLPISARWAGVKLKWLIDNIDTVQEAYRNGDLRFGTLDSWLLWQLTAGECYATDVTNASYTMLMNLHRCCWDSSICKFIEIDINMLPEIKSSSELFGKVTQDSPSGIGGLPITGSVCDIKASIIGCQATQPGSVSLHIDPKIGVSHVTITIGEELLFYRSMLKGIGYVLSTASYQFGKKSNVVYSLEATLYNSQNLLTWFRDCLHLSSSSEDVDSVANSVTDSNGCYFIPTTGASHSPLERSQYRHVNIWGLNLTNSRPGHIVRASLESVAIEINQLLTSLSSVVGRPYKVLNVSGRGLDRSEAFCQTLADLTGLRVERLAMSEAVILGGALLAVYGVNLDPSGLQGPIKEGFSSLMVPGEQRRRCRQWISLANEQEFLDHRFWIGSEDDINITSIDSGKLERNKKYLSSNRNWGWKFLSVIMIGTPFTLIGFATALLISRTRFNIL